MSVRPKSAALLLIALLALGAGPAAVPAPVRLVVQNETYSSLLIAMVDGSGREVTLGQAPPEFSNTLLVAEPPTSGPVRFLARLVGEKQVLYRSEALRLASGMKLRWRLPDNVLEN